MDATTIEAKTKAIKALRDKLLRADLGENALFPAELKVFDDLFAGAVAQLGALKGAEQFPKTEVRSKIPLRLKAGEVFVAKGRPLDAVLLSAQTNLDALSPMKGRQGGISMPLPNLQVVPKPKMYAFMDEDTGMMFVSAYADGDPLWELNHIELCEFRNGKVTKNSSVVNIFRNVMYQAGVNVVME